MDKDVKQLALQGQMIRAIQLLRERTGADFDEARTAVNAELPVSHRLNTGGLRSVLVAALALLVGGLVVLGVLFVASTALQRLSAWTSETIVLPNLAWLLRPEFLTLVGVGVLLGGLPFARRFRRPARFRGGVIAVALAAVTFWPLQYAAASADLGYREYDMFLHGLALFVSICLLSGGLEAMRRASNTPQADSWEFLE